MKDKFVCMELDSVRVKGKTQPVKICILVGYRHLPDEQDRIVNQFNEAVTLYRGKKWDKAIRLFGHINATDPNHHEA